jgi:type II secretory pathway component GspD/PulD (secretin)
MVIRVAMLVGVLLIGSLAWAQEAAPPTGDDTNLPEEPTSVDDMPPPGTVEVSFADDGLHLFCLNADAHEVFARIGVAAGLRVMVNDTVNDRITANFVGLPPHDALSRITAAYGLSMADVGGVIMISEGVPNGPASYLASEIATVPTQYVPADRVKTLMPTFLQNHIKMNREQNAVVLSAPSNVIEKFRRDIQQLDVPAEQIMIEVFMVELTDSTMDDLGVELSYSDGGTGLGSNSNDGSLTYHGVAWLPTSFGASLTALASDSRAKIRARPRIATVSGQRAEIFIGIERFLDKTVRRLGQSGGEQTSIDAGVRLRLRPYSGTGDIIIVDIDEAEISTLSAPDPVTGLPNRTARTAETSVRVADGQTIILGGLVQTESREDEGGIPILRDIPVIGKLFEKTRTEEIETELVIFITPRKLTRTGHLPPQEEADIGERFDVDLSERNGGADHSADDRPHRPQPEEE